ncbi:hypothetical protein DBR44_00005 [Aquitalea sp. FJL05]|uniref:DUF2726 domain-containing protein n=1 Tax=Aquitalea sp. FJL05 TaxID=2153366 RepID=UPI000F5A8BE5|nr:DUF2726 domain-containing protein [Aquitalea sp. FJL05]RQO78177.1 hypothetical protein DBR44_00005 [Aquitalea sp. FJL05]
MIKALSLSLLLASASAAAQVYTCTDPQTGRPIYSNYPGCTVMNTGQPAPGQVVQPSTPAQATPQPLPTTPALPPAEAITPQPAQAASQQVPPLPVVIPAPSLMGPIMWAIKWPLIFMAIVGVLAMMMPRRRRGTRGRGKRPDLRQEPRTASAPEAPPELKSPPVVKKPMDYGNARFCLKNPSLLTEREQGCYWRLVEHLSPDFIVLAQVGFSQLLSVKGGANEQNNALFGTMRQKVADFVVCRKDLSVVAVIELDDSSHRGKEEQDKKRDAAVRQAGLLAFRLPNTPGNEPVKNLADVLRRMYLGADFVSSNAGPSPATKETR